MVLYFPLPTESTSKPDRCTFRMSFPSRSALEGRLLTIEGKNPSLTLTEVTLPHNFHGSALSELTWNRKPATRKEIGTIPVAFGNMNATFESSQCPLERVVLQMDLNCSIIDERDAERCRVEFRGFDLSDTFGRPALV